MKTLTISATGLALLLAGLTAPPAQAAPCSQWGFAGETRFNQSNGWAAGFNSTGQRAQGPAWAYPLNDPNVFKVYQMRGTVDGGINGHTVNFVVRWDGGELGTYEGRVDANGIAAGVTYDARTPSSRATWTSNQPLRCVTAS